MFPKLQSFDSHPKIIKIWLSKSFFSIAGKSKIFALLQMMSAVLGFAGGSVTTDRFAVLFRSIMQLYP